MIIGGNAYMSLVQRNVRRCLPANAEVFTRKGLKHIKDVEVGEEVLTSEGYEKVVNKFEQGQQKLIKIITQDGDFRCTPNHRMAVCTTYDKYEWKEAKSLEKGDRLLTSRIELEGSSTKLPAWTYCKMNITCKDIYPPVLDADIAWLIGLFQGDGYTYPNYQKNGFNAYISIVLGLNEYDIAEKAREQLQRFGDNLHITLKKRKDENSFMVHCQSKQLAWYFDKYVKQAKTEIRTPDYIRNATTDIRLAYVAGVADSDGALNNRPIQVVTTVYEKFARDLQNILYSCGMESRFVVCSKDYPSRQGWQQLYKVNLITKRSQQLFSEVPQLQKSMRITSRSQNANGFPSSFENVAKIKTEYGLYANKQFNIDSYNFQYGDNWFAPTEVIIIIDDQQEEETYDIEVKNTHEFFCNGYLTHNSAEISLGDVSDTTFTNLKNYELNPERAEIGWMSNNSVVLDQNLDFEDFNHIPEMASRICDNGEPGMINLYNIQKYGRYGKEMHDDATLVNPCFSEDTMIAVADGRGCVSIKELAEKGTDVPVYSMDRVTNEISIKWGRNPRITGHDRQLLRIHFDNGTHMDVTPNHKFFLNDGRIDVEAKDLKKGDSLPKFKKIQFSDQYVRIHIGTRKYKVEHRMIKEFLEKDKFYENYEDGKYNGCCRTHGVVVHHKDENKSNNNPDNLEITTFADHNSHHNQDFVGSGNPMYGKKHKDSTKKLIGKKAVERCEDPDYRKMLSDAQTPEMRQNNSVRMTTQKKQWDTEKCDEYELEAKKSGLRTIRPLPEKLLVVRICENSSCAKEFHTTWNKREQGYCCTSCANTKKESIVARKEGQAKTYEGKAKDNFHKQAMIYKDLLEQGTVLKKQWEQACKEQGVSCRFNAKSPNKWIAGTWGEFKKMVDDYNHRVSWIEELNGQHTVYNITVDDHHTLAVVTRSENEKLNLSGVFTSQCGEICLSNYELCNLSEVFPPRCDTPQRFYEALKFATFYSSTVALLPTHRPESNTIIAKNRRIGVSISGVAQWASSCVPVGWGRMNYTKMTQYLRTGYKIVRSENKRLADSAGVPASIRVTTVKPSGSISLLAGVTPGVHYPVSRYAIRRMRIGADSPLVQPLKDAGIRHEKDTYSDNTLVFEFVIDHGAVRPCEEVSPWEQFSLVALMQRCWADNCVSATIYFDQKKDADDVEKLLAMYIPILKSVSMLPHNNGIYAQAPYEKIDKDEYEKRLQQYRMPSFDSVKGNVPVGSKFCSGDKCEL